ncbi:YdeI/OmpD-associated family protein [Labrys okinawensis]|uniref:YdeI/OmpD-associated family protein n=1 Tax=Labrys okinawensis TaxID=346911 RepID=UPI0039BD3FAA
MVPAKTDLPILAFATAAKFEEWLAFQSAQSPGLWVKFAKKGCKTPTVSKPDAIDVALCHGWIDGQIESFDEDHFLTRFTPRKSASIWSENNRKRALVLVEEGRMRAAGLAQIEQAKADGRWEKAYAPQSKAEIPEDLAVALAGNASAARFFQTLSGANRYAILHRLHNAKKPETRERKLAQFIVMLEREETIHPQKKG